MLALRFLIIIGKILNFDKSFYSALYFGVTFSGHSILYMNAAILTIVDSHVTYAPISGRFDDSYLGDLWMLASLASLCASYRTHPRNDLRLLRDEPFSDIGNITR